LVCPKPILPLPLSSLKQPNCFLNFQLDYSKIDSENHIAADSKIGSENHVAADSKIDQKTVSLPISTTSLPI
jgi:hypothetical protein